MNFKCQATERTCDIFTAIVYIQAWLINTCIPDGASSQFKQRFLFSNLHQCYNIKLAARPLFDVLSPDSDRLLLQHLLHFKIEPD